jgi:pimeloyl-ACP methyl ester carboxylesterase
MGTGEVTRYLGTYGSARVRRAVLFGAIPPFLLKTDDNPEGVDGQVFEDIKASVLADRYAYFKDFLDNFYNVDKLAPERISEQAWQASFNVAAGASPYASYACVDTWLTDFRGDLPKIDVPVLVLHGGPDPPVRVDGEAAAGSRRESHADPGRRRSAQHRLDAPGRMQQGAARLPRRRSSEWTPRRRPCSCHPDDVRTLGQSRLSTLRIRRRSFVGEEAAEVQPLLPAAE